MMLFDAEGRIKRYDTPEEVLLEFFDLRLQYYELRRVALLGEATWEHRRASNKIRFILAVIQGQLVVNNRKKADIEGDLEAMGFDKLTKSNPVRPCMAGGGGGTYGFSWSLCAWQCRDFGQPRSLSAPVRRSV
jgi:DNA topoisomerase-2